MKIIVRFIFLTVGFPKYFEKNHYNELDFGLNNMTSIFRVVVGISNTLLLYSKITKKKGTLLPSFFIKVINFFNLFFFLIQKSHLFENYLIKKIYLI